MDDKDKDIQAMAHGIWRFETVEPMVEELKILLLPTDPHDDKNVIWN